MDEDSFTKQRQKMVEGQIIPGGVTDEAVLDAMRRVPRHLFVPGPFHDQAYADTPLPIPRGQTISQPLMVGLMLQALCLKPTDKVLDIGTGSGYAAALLAQLAAEVYSVERFQTLVSYAQKRLQQLGCTNVTLRLGDGTLGWLQYAPYDAIVVAASGPKVPAALLRQLTIGGRLVIPIGPLKNNQTLLRITHTTEKSYQRENLGPVRFVPLVGEAGWQNKAEPNE